MNSVTKQKLTDITRFLRRNGKKLVHAYSNVNGVYLDRRQRNNEVVNRFCIVFNVSEKFPIEEVSKKIPKYIRVTATRKGKIITHKVPTDVRSVGIPKLQTCLISSRAGSTVSEGTITGFIELDGKRFYISNMHVLGMPYIEEEAYEAEDETTELNVRVAGRDSCAFRRGRITLEGEYDVAICEKIKHHPEYEIKDLDQFFHVPEEDLAFVMNEPITINCFGRLNETYGEGEIVNIIPTPVTFALDFENLKISISNLLLIHPKITDSGDSGALIYDDDDNAYGMILGADRINSYAINLDKAITYLIQ